jgi:hypothetical protein
MVNCLNINLDINPLREGLDINSFDKIRHVKFSFDDINPKLISFFNNLNLTVTWAELFYVPSFFCTTIHTDIDWRGKENDYTKINYVFGGKDSRMYWWKIKPGVSNTIERTALSSQYINYKQDQVDLIEEQSIGFPSIVQAGIPHNIRTFSEARRCLSLVLRKEYNTRLTMAESIEIFKEYL